MTDDSKHHIELDGTLVAELLDQSEHPSNIGNVAAISDQQIVLLRRDKRELVNYRFEYFDVRDCHAIRYQKETAYYRIIVGAACFLAAAFFVFMLLAGVNDMVEQGGPLIIGTIASVTIGIRFVTSTHRHVIRFELPDQTLTWRSPAIDIKSRVTAAHAVREYARERGILETR